MLPQLRVDLGAHAPCYPSGACEAIYSRAVDRLGGLQTLWDGWCSYVADREPDIYQSADHVSALHCEAIGC